MNMCSLRPKYIPVVDTVVSTLSSKNYKIQP